jgi:dipeptidyl aminopeptidase/acylaminoacyl peptidase
MFMKRLTVCLWFVLLVSLLTACSGKTILHYRISGTSEEVNVHFVNELGETNDLMVKPPFDLEFEMGNSFSFLIYVTNISGQGDVICEVFADEQRLGDAKGNIFAGCEGSYERQGNDIQTRFTSHDDVFPEGYNAPAIKLPEGLNGMILFAGDQKEAERRDFYVFDLDAGGELIQLTDGLGRSSSCPKFSPDGKQFSFVYGGSVSDLFVLNMNDGGLANLTNDAKTSIEEFCADWSPDGSQIIFSAAREESPNDWIQQIYSARTDGSGIIPLTANTNENEDYQDPVWSPDGRKIAFISGILAGKAYQMNADGSDLTLFSDLEASVEDFHWSPDGTQIVYACHSATGEAVCTMNSDGSGSLTLTDDSFEGIYHTAWSPDGTKIAFAARSEGVTNIYVMDPDGTDLNQVTHLQDMIPYWIVWISSVDLPDTPIPVSIGN